MTGASEAESAYRDQLTESESTDHDDRLDESHEAETRLMESLASA